MSLPTSELIRAVICCEGVFEKNDIEWQVQFLCIDRIVVESESGKEHEKMTREEQLAQIFAKIALRIFKKGIAETERSAAVQIEPVMNESESVSKNNTNRGLAMNTTKSKGLPELLTVKQLESLFQISTPRAYELIHSKGFPTVKIGRFYRVDKQKLLKMIDSGFVI